MIFGGGGKAAKKAAKIQAQAQREAIAEQRRQFDLTRRDLAPFREAGLEFLPTLQEGATAEGLDARLSRIFGTEGFQALKDERTRAIEGQLSAGGLTRSGAAIEAAAAIPADLGFQIENLLTGRAGDLVGRSQAATTQTAGFGQQSANNISNLLQNLGRTQASGILAGQQSDAASLQGLINAGASIFSGAGGFSSLAGLFSDPRLKENLHIVNRIGPLNVYEWDWIETESEVLKALPTRGFITPEVKQYYPQHVFDFAGFEAIDYERLLEALEFECDVKEKYYANA